VYAILARRAGAEIELRVAVGAFGQPGAGCGVDTRDGPIDGRHERVGSVAGVLAATAGADLLLVSIPRHVPVTGPFPGAPERRTLVIDALISFLRRSRGRPGC
jgi:hypothetical protein